MTETQHLLQRFIDDRDSVSDDELETLVNALRGDPDSAAQLKEQLILNEWLSQRYAIDRQDFSAQVGQRVRDFELGEERLGQQVDDVRRLAERELRQFDNRTRRAKWSQFVLALSAVVLVGAGIGVWLMVSSQGGIEVVEVIQGDSQSDLNLGSHVRTGEPVVTGKGEMVRLRYEDGTVVRIGAKSSVRFHSGPGKRVDVTVGEVSADVAKQEPGRPMVFRTPTADAKVVGTKLTVSVRDESTWLNVDEGSVEFSRSDDKSKVLVERNHVGVATADELSVSEVNWPVNRSNLVFAFQSAAQPNLVDDAATGAPRRCTFQPRGAARLSDDILHLEGGAFVADDSEKMMYAAFRQSGEITVMATIQPARLEQSGPARVISCAADNGNYNLMIGQQNDRLIGWFRTTGKESQAEVDLSGLSIGAANHVVITYKPGRLVCYLNGEAVLETDQVRGDFGNWSGYPLVVGNDGEPAHAWHGSLQGIAIFNRFLNRDEVLANTSEFRKLMQER